MQRVLLVAVMASGLSIGCDAKPTSAGPAPSASGAPGAPPPASAAAVATAAPAASAGPVVTIPAGKLVAGAACGDHPRLPSEEPGGVSFDLGEYSIDAYPYPNDPASPARTGVTREDAAKLCAARGRRLCSELEWERACKGPKNTRYEYGDRFDAKKCSLSLGSTPNGGPVGALEGCKSGFGVSAMHGFVFEWTSSAWERDANESRGVARGGFGNQPFAHLRCSAVKMVEPTVPDDKLGFRCCGGPESPAKVKLESDPRPALEPVEPLDPALALRVQSAMKNGRLKADDGADYTVQRAWRWHPVGHEELILASVSAATEAGAAATLAIVAELCEKTAQLSNRAKTTVDELGDPAARSPARAGALPGEPPRQLVTFPAKRGGVAGEIQLEYQFGQVVITTSGWP
jgi:hypothetical protein